MTSFPFRTIILFATGYQPETASIAESILAEHLAGTQISCETLTSQTQSDWENTLSLLINEQGISLILTIGGIDPADCVPDATEAICDKLFPGFGTLIREIARPQNPAALLWRNTAGLRNQTLIVNLPHSVEAIRAGLPLLFPGIPNAIRLAGKS